MNRRNELKKQYLAQLKGTIQNLYALAKLKGKKKQRALENAPKLVTVADFQDMDNETFELLNRFGTKQYDQLMAQKSRTWCKNEFKLTDQHEQRAHFMAQKN